MLSRYADPLIAWDPFLASSALLPSGAPNMLMRPLREWESAPLSLGAIDFLATPTSYEYHADVPGMQKKDVKVQLIDGNTLKISGEREHHKSFDEGNVHRSERSYGKFSRSFRLPPTADPAQINATVANGVLSVSVNKTPAELAAKRAVTDVPVK